jgi:hypothetical protein
LPKRSPFQMLDTNFLVQQKSDCADVFMDMSDFMSKSQNPRNHFSIYFDFFASFSRPFQDLTDSRKSSQHSTSLRIMFQKCFPLHLRPTDLSD